MQHAGSLNSMRNLQEMTTLRHPRRQELQARLKMSRIWRTLFIGRIKHDKLKLTARDLQPRSTGTKWSYIIVLLCTIRDILKASHTFLLHFLSHSHIAVSAETIVLCNTPGATIPSGTCRLTRSAFVCNVWQGVPSWFDERYSDVDNRQIFHMSPLTRSKVRLPRW
jgi:hypothetical protein